MVEEFIQEFAPSIKISLDGLKEESIEQRNWSKTIAENTKDNVSYMGYLGRYQIEEVWKHYHKDIYVSNYGYVARIEEKEAREIFGDKFEDFKKDCGVVYQELNNQQKNLIKDKNEVPYNSSEGYPSAKYSRCQVCLHVKGGDDLHKIVAKLFLKAPHDHEKGGWLVHHIDNNSYNNSVANLIWLRSETHQGNNHKIFHPMS